MAVEEVIVVTDEIRDLVIAGASSNEIKNLAISEGMMSLRDDGLLKLVRGETTLEEVLRVTAEE
jgi:type II secretory ATPase GspE/PulE/Tfp pilus assembly ATPase PilB-like protein